MSEFVTDPHVRTAAAFIFGLAFLLTVISGIVAAFNALKLTNRTAALGLPEGSIRAIIALVLVLIFIVMAIYLIETVFVADASEDAKTAATQLLATVGTLVAAVAAFYFGTGAVTSGAKTAATAMAAGKDRPPAAMTKGSKKIGDAYELHGFVNPHGRETQYYFQYGLTRTYGDSTSAASAGAGNADRLVSSDPVSGLDRGWHLRLVAHSEAGTTYGDDAEITEQESPLESGDEATAESESTEEGT